MREMMRQVVVRGTARAADVEGYEVGGKTGTADKPNAHGGYARDKTISTFASFFPASAPEYVLVILLDEPTQIINKTAFRTAGLTAAPVLGHAIRRLAPILGMRPQAAPGDGAPLLYTLAGNE
jgi:cell division protein FtsI (penicillin-binding protein 3)